MKPAELKGFSWSVCGALAITAANMEEWDCSKRWVKCTDISKHQREVIIAITACDQVAIYTKKEEGNNKSP